MRQEQFLQERDRDEAGNFGPEWGEVVEIEEENWYFKLSDHTDWLKDFIETHPDIIIPAFRKSELLNALERNVRHRPLHLPPQGAPALGHRVPVR